MSYEERAFLPAWACYSVDVSPDDNVIYAPTHFGDWDEGVSLYDAHTYTLIKGLHPLPTVPKYILASADGIHLYATAYYQGAVVKVRVADGAVVNSIPVGPWPVGMVFDSARRYLYAMVNNPYSGAVGDISIIDTSTDTVVGTIGPISAAGDVLAISADDQFLYAIGSGAQTLYKMSIAGRSVVASVIGVQPGGMSVSPEGNLLYVADRCGGVVRVFQTSNMAELASIPVADVNGFWVAPSGDHGLAVCYAPGSNELVLQVVELPSGEVLQTLSHTLQMPDALLAYPLSDPALWRRTTGELLIPILREHGGVLVLGPADGGPGVALELVGSYDTSDRAYSVAVVGNVAYVTDYANGLVVLDVSDLGDIRLLGSCDTPQSAYCLTVLGNLAFVGDHDAGVQVLDVSDPSNVRIVGSYDTERPFGITVRDGLAFVGDAFSGLQVLDVSDPGDIRFVGGYDTPHYAHRPVLVGNLAFIGDGDSGLQVLDISDPREIAFVGSYDTPDHAWDLVVSGDLAFVADNSSGLRVLNVSDPANIVRKGSYDTPDRTLRLALVGNLAFLADMDSGVLVLDVSDPAAIRLVAAYDTPGYASDVVVVGDYLFVADGPSGLLVLRWRSPNRAPVADANGPYTALATGWDGVLVQLDGSASHDPDGDLITSAWDLDLAVDGSDPDSDPANDVDSTEMTPTAQFPIGQTDVSLVVTDEHELSSEPGVTTVTVSVIDVAIDIKPGSYPNSINLGSNGVVPVAFLTTQGFDASTIDPLTVTLRGESFEGLVKLRGKKQEPMADLVDVDGDGDLDLVVHLDTENLALEPDALQCTLGALTYDGFVVSGADTVHIVPQQ